MSEILHYTKNGVTNEGLKELGKPFHESQIEWKIQTVKADGSQAMVVPYVDSRAVQNRLDEVCGVHNWRNLFNPVKSIESGKEIVNMLCGISIRLEALEGDFLTKWNGSSPTMVEKFKGVISTAERRTGSEWGIGRDIYDISLDWVTLYTDQKKGKIKASYKDKKTDKYQYVSFDPPRLPEMYRDPEKPDTDLSDMNKTLGTSQKTWDDLLSYLKDHEDIKKGISTVTNGPVLKALEKVKGKSSKELCGFLIKYVGEK